MPEKDPMTYGILTYVWIGLLASWGGAVNWIRKAKTAGFTRINLKEFIGEIVTSAFTGVVTFWSCEAAGFVPLWTAVLVAISGHMGGRLITQIEKLVERWIDSRTGLGAGGKE